MRATLVFLSVALVFQSGAAQRTRSRSKVLESFATEAGVLKLIRIDDYDIGETNWLVSLNGKKLYRTQDDVFGSVSFHTVFKGLASGEAILMQEIFNPGECAEFRIISIAAKGKPTITNRFGVCEPLITRFKERITFSFAAKPDAKSDSWVYQDGKLARQ